MAPKRKEINSPQRQSKKPKRDHLAEKLQRQLSEVAKALNGADISKELGKMLDIVLPFSLGEYSDQRHRFQEQVVEAIGSILGEVEAALKQDVTDKRSQRDAASAEKPLRESEAAEAANALEAKIAEVHRLKVTLAEKATAFRAAKASLAAAEEAKVEDGQKVRETEKKKVDFVGATEHLNFLKAASSDDADGRKKKSELMALLKKYKFEESMMIALPAAFSKAPDARGQFDHMAINQLEGEIAKFVAEIDAVLAAAAPGQAKCEEAIKAAAEQLASAKGEQRVAAKAFDVASKEQADCEAASATAQKAVRSNAQLSKKLEKSLNDAEVEVELFEQGPRQTFKELCERTTPPPAMEAEDEENMVTTPAKADEDLLPVAEPEVPVIAAA